MVDEARCYKEEKLSIVLRYVIGLEVDKSFIGFFDYSTSRGAQILAKIIFDFLNKCGLGNVPILAQSYDGASVMSGKHKGLQAIIKEKYRHAICVHCLAHKLNLALVDSCANVSPATHFFNYLDVHFSQPGSHADLKKLQDSLNIKTGREMGSLSTTRWSCRHDNCKAIINNYDAIKTALEVEINENKDKHVAEAIGLLTYIFKPRFLVCLLPIEKFTEKYEISLEPTRVSKHKNRVGVGEGSSMDRDFCVGSTLGKRSWIDMPSGTCVSEY